MENRIDRLEKIKTNLVSNMEGERVKIKPIAEALISIIDELIFIENEKPKKKGLFK